MRTFLRNYAYPFIQPVLRKLTAGVIFSGRYATWQAALSRASGYDTPEIAQRVKDAAMKVNRGEAAYERDSVLFDEIQYSWPILTGLMWIATQRGNRLRVVDFGGSLGSTYIQAKRFLDALQECSWNIVEQKTLADFGREHLSDSRLHFYDDLDACMDPATTDALLLASVLQYVPDPPSFLADIVRRRVPFILIDRTPFLTVESDYITIQRVPPSIYPASYPAWLMNLNRFKSRMDEEYELIAEYTTTDTANIPVVFKGFFYRLRTP